MFSSKMHRIMLNAADAEIHRQSLEIEHLEKSVANAAIHAESRVAQLEAELATERGRMEKLWRVMHSGHPVITLTLRVDQRHSGPDKLWCSIDNFDTEMEIGRGDDLAAAIDAIKEEENAK